MLIIGKISLNCSFILYLLMYLPQIYHNYKSPHIASYSLGMHYILYSSLWLDLIYGFSSELPWQYKSVSVIGVILLTIQHLQLTASFLHEQKRYWLTFNLLYLVILSSLIVCFFNTNATLNTLQIAIIGYTSRLGFIVYTLPQIIKNKRSISAQAISITYVFISLTLAWLDTISAWCLDWGWPNKLASPLTIILLLILLKQCMSASSHKFKVAPNQNFL